MGMELERGQVLKQEKCRQGWKKAINGVKFDGKMTKFKNEVGSYTLAQVQYNKPHYQVYKR